MELGLTRRNIGRLVLLIWAVMLAWLARREFAKGDAARTAEEARRLEPGAQYFAVLAGGRQIGQLNLSVDTLLDGVRLSEQFVLDLPLGDSTRQLARGTELLLSRALRLRQLSRSAFGIGPQERLFATLGDDAILSITDEEGEQVAGRVRIRIEPDAIVAGMLPYRAAFGGELRVGARFQVPLLDLGRPGTRLLEVAVTAESTFVLADSAEFNTATALWSPASADTIRAWRLEHDAPGAPTVTWVDAGGAVVQQDTPGGLSFRRSAFEIVGNNYRRARRAESSAWRRDLAAMTPLVGSGFRPDTLTRTRRFLTAPALPGLEGGRQSRRGDTLVVSRDPRAGPGDPAEGRRALGPGWDLPTLDDEIRRAAGEALSGARTGRDSARVMTGWVAREIATDPELTASGTALNTLRNRAGNADGKARLLATLARVAGIPARVVSGVAVLPQGVFGHAWAELWLDGWVAADPSFGHFPASASLVRLRVGERGRAPDLLPLVASARFLPLDLPR
jgi:transglutaminase-like putative cysteine protease